MAFTLRTRSLKLYKLKSWIQKQHNSLYHQTNPLISNTEVHQKVDLEDKVALITGGASGIGFSIAKQFLTEGASAVAIVDIDKTKGEDSVNKLSKEFGDNRVNFFEADVADSKQMDRAFKSTVLHYQGVNVVVNNAGILNDTSWEQQIKSNLHGYVIGTLLGMQHMSKSSIGDGGTVVNIASIMGLIPSSGCPLHTMTQFGVVGFTRGIGASSHFTRTGVKIMALCAGLTDTTLLTKTPYNAINENFEFEFMEEVEKSLLQQPVSVAKGLVEIMDDAKPGSVWLAENDKPPYEIQFPEICNVELTKRSVA